MGIEPIIGDHTPADHPDVNAGMKGLIPRDLVMHAVGYSAVIPISTIKPHDYDTMVRMIADQEKAGSRNSDILRRGDAGKPIPSTDQNGQGYCWFYGAIGALQCVRARMNLPYRQLSGHAGGCKIKKFRDEGGWGALGVEFLLEHGCPDTDHWPEKSMSRSHDTPATWENAKLYKADMVVADLASPVYNRDLSYGQQLTVLLNGGCTVDDYDWQGHCTFGCDVVNGATQRGIVRGEAGKIPDLAEFDKMFAMNDPVTRGLGKRSRNSWSERYGDRGYYVLTGSKAVGSNSVGILTAIAA
jgi:hypothetical protein